MKVVMLLKLNIHLFFDDYVIHLFYLFISNLSIKISSIINLNSMNIFLFHFLNISNSWKTTSQSPNRYFGKSASILMSLMSSGLLTESNLDHRSFRAGRISRNIPFRARTEKLYSPHKKPVLRSSP